MRKIIGAIFTFMGLAIVFSACGGETYADKLKKEKQSIERFINDNKITTRGTYPDGHKFADNEYYLDGNTGVYFRVIDPGNNERPIIGKTNIYLRYDTIRDLLNDKIYGSNFQGPNYMSFRYGNKDTYMQSSSYAQEYYFLSQACVLPLERGLGNNAEVSLIVPFMNGSNFQQLNYTPYFYKRLRYQFTLDETEETKE